jgi:hypothetical protein
MTPTAAAKFLADFGPFTYGPGFTIVDAVGRTVMRSQAPTVKFDRAVLAVLNEATKKGRVR